MLPKRKRITRVAPIISNAIHSKKFIDLRLNYLRKCSHDIKLPAACPICKLAHSIAETVFLAESFQREKKRSESYSIRAERRINLLYNWECHQALHFKELETEHCLQMFLSKGLINRLLDNPNLVQAHFANKVSFELLMKLLDRRNRMRDIGHLAALYIQARVRKLLVKRRVRRELLERIEYVHATKKKEEFFIDKVKQRKLRRYPLLLQNERPGTPRTIARRLDFEAKEKIRRLECMNRLINEKDMLGMKKDNIFEEESNVLGLFKEMAILRDSVSLAFNILRQKLYASKHGERLTVWFSLAPPGPASRPYSLAIALCHHPSPPLFMIETRKKEVFASSSGKWVSGAGGSSNLGSAHDLAVNRALQALEQVAFDSLLCQHPEDVLKHLANPDIIPLCASVLNISEDDSDIWDGSISKIDNSQMPAAQIERGANEIIPMSFFIRPIATNYGPSSIFRVFLYAEELVAASSYSPHVFYPEIFKNKDQILASIKSFSSKSSFKNAVRGYYRDINSTVAHKQSVSRQSELSKAPLTSLYCPSQRLVLPGGENFDPVALSQLSDSQVLTLREKYKFLSKIGIFMDRYKRAQANESRRAVRGAKHLSAPSPDDFLINEDKPTLYSNLISNNALASNVASQLSGAAVWELLNSKKVSVPLNSLAHPYNQSLLDLSLGTSTDMKQRIRRPEGMNDYLSSSQLLVLDLHVQLPPPTLSHQPEHHDNAASKNERSSERSKFMVTVHQVVGLFDCSMSRAPQNLDTGLFSFQHFRNIHRLCSKEVDSDGSDGYQRNVATTEDGASGGDRGWSAISPQSGICIGKTLLKSGIEFQFALLGAPPSTDYLRDELPKKVQTWLGWVD